MRQAMKEKERIATVEKRLRVKISMAFFRG